MSEKSGKSDDSKHGHMVSRFGRQKMCNLLRFVDMVILVIDLLRMGLTKNDGKNHHDNSQVQTEHVIPYLYPS